jgi:hypothetical protein
VNKQLAQSAVGIGAGTLVYTCPNGYTVDIKDINIANTTAGILNFTMHVVPLGGSPSAANMVYPGAALAANTLTRWTGIQSMKAGGFIQCIGSGAGITVTLTGEEFRTGV